MAENEDPADAALRLEAALERIARQAHKLDASRARPPPATDDTVRIAARLDALIAQIRAALGPAAGA